MLNEPISDPTEGERARKIREHPEVAQPIVDPTDPRAGARVPRNAPRRVRTPVRDLETPAPRRGH